MTLLFRAIRWWISRILTAAIIRSWKKGILTTENRIKINSLLTEEMQDSKSWKKRFEIWTSEGSGSLLFPIIILVISILISLSSYWFPSWIHYELSTAQAVDLLNQQVSLLVGLLAVIFVLVGFVFTAIQLKKSNERIFNLLIAKTYFRPIFLFVILELLFVNALTYLPSLFSTEVFVPLAGTTFYLSFISIASTGVLFFRVSGLFSERAFLTMYTEKGTHLIKKLLIGNLERSVGKEILIASLKRLPIKVYDSEVGILNINPRASSQFVLDQNPDLINALESQHSSSGRRTYIADINLYKLSKALIEASKHIQYNAEIDKQIFVFIHPSSHQILVHKDMPTRIVRKIRRAYLLQPVKTKSDEDIYEKIRINFQNIEEIVSVAIRENDTNKIEAARNYFMFLISIHKNTSAQNIHILTHITETITHSIQSNTLFDNKNRSSFLRLLKINSELFYLLSERGTEEGLRLVKNYLEALLGNEVRESQLFSLATDQTTVQLKSIIQLFVFREIKQSDDIELWTNKLTQLEFILSLMSTLLKITYGFNTLNEFISVIEKLNRINDYYTPSIESKLEPRQRDFRDKRKGITDYEQFLEESQIKGRSMHAIITERILFREQQLLTPIERDLEHLTTLNSIEDQIFTALRFTNIGISSWVLYSYQKDETSLTVTLSYLHHLRFPSYGLQTLYDDLCRILSERYFKFHWWNWRVPSQVQREGISPIDSPSSWLVLGISCQMLGGNFEFDQSQIPEDSLVGNLASTLAPTIKKIDSEIERWIPIIFHHNPTINQDEAKKKLKDRITKFDQFCKSIDSSFENKEFKDLSESKLSEEKVQRFKDETLDAWRKSRFLFDLYDRRKKVERKTFDKIQSIPRSGLNITLTKGKLLLGEKDVNVFWQSDMGVAAAKNEETDIIHQLLSSENELAFSGKIPEGMDLLLENLEYSSSSPEIFILDPRAAYNQDLQSSPYFTGIRYAEENPKNMIGKYKGLEVYVSYSREIDNKILALTLSQSNKLVQYSHPDWLDEVLEIEIEELSQEEAEKVYEADPNFGTKSAESLNTEEEVLNRINSSLKVKVLSAVEVQISNPKTHFWVSIKSERR